MFGLITNLTDMVMDNPLYFGIALVITVVFLYYKFSSWFRSTDETFEIANQIENLKNTVNQLQNQFAQQLEPLNELMSKNLNSEQVNEHFNNKTNEENSLTAEEIKKIQEQINSLNSDK